jgi:hypothetical protein
MHKLTPLEPIDYLVIGHITRDLTPEGPRLGGTVAYSGLTARALGLRVGIVTSWGEEMPLGPLADISIANLSAESSTTFENVNTPEGRIQIIHSVAPRLDLHLIPRNMAERPYRSPGSNCPGGRAQSGTLFSNLTDQFNSSGLAARVE